MSRVDCHVTPVWALYSNEEEAEIIHGILPRYNGPRLPTSMAGEGGKWTSRSRWYETKEELIKENGIQPACSCCGQPYSTHWCEPYPKLLVQRNLCFSCNHWIHSTIPQYGRPGFLVINGEVYSYDADKPKVVIRNDGQFYGFGGREFRIKLANGTIVETNNLWSGGRIPQRFLAQLPDNAEFVKWPEPVGHGQGFLG